MNDRELNGELTALIGAVRDGRISAAERERLEALLSEDEQARRTYRMAMTIHGLLEQSAVAISNHAVPEESATLTKRPTVPSERDVGRTGLIWAVIAAAAAVLFAFSAPWLMVENDDQLALAPAKPEEPSVGKNEQPSKPFPHNGDDTVDDSQPKGPPVTEGGKPNSEPPSPAPAAPVPPQASPVPPQAAPASPVPPQASPRNPLPTPPQAAPASPIPPQAAPEPDPPIDFDKLHVVTVQVTAPTIDYRVKIEAIHQIGNELWVVARISRMGDEDGDDAVAQLTDRVYIKPHPSTLKYKMVGVKWNWQRDTESTEFVKDEAALMKQIVEQAQPIQHFRKPGEEPTATIGALPDSNDQD